ncbi:MAG: EAL domain-containing protein [Pyrinomonadaceae bacterium]
MSEIGCNKERLLIVDDEPEIRDVLYEFLRESYQCVAVSSAEEALALMATEKFDLVISDITMERMTGLEMVPYILSLAPQTVIVMLSGQQTIEYAIEAIRAGAFDYVTKPFDLCQVDAAVRRALDHHKLLEAKLLYENNLEELVKQRTAEVEHLAYYDTVTALPNRALFEARLAQAMAVARCSGKLHGALLFSVDGFKKINDTLGHAVGDLLLKDLARRLKQCATGGDTLARLDGDEFALLLTEVTGRQDLVEISRVINEILKPAFLLEGHKICVTASIGISLFPCDAEDCESLLRNAGVALHRARMQGGNTYQFYTPDMNARALRGLALESSLRRSVENEEFVIHYQPQVDIESGEIVGNEALVRWQHPQLGLLPPAEFIGLAEKNGSIVDIGDFVMRVACEQTRQWQLYALSALHIAVNISARQLKQKDFIVRLVEILDDADLDPASLELELTETSIMEDPKSAARLLGDIRSMGVKIAIDDFGTGYSSLSYLRRLPIDTVKLDRSFVNGVTAHPDDAALVMAIVTLAHNLRLRVIAEGVETEEQLNFLRLLRCDQGQGYFFDKPAAPELIKSRWLREVVHQEPAVLATMAEGKRIPARAYEAFQ